MAPRVPASLLVGALAAAPLLAQPAVPSRGLTEELLAERAAKDHAGPPWAEMARTSADLSKVAWMSRRGGPWVVVVNGQAVGPAADESSPWDMARDGRVVRAGRVGKAWTVWVDGNALAGPFDDVRAARFTDDGHVVFAAKRGKSWSWFLDGKALPVSGTDVGWIEVAGPRAAYVLKMPDGWHVVVDGQAGPAFQQVPAGLLSEDGARFAYLGVRKEGVVTVVDGKEEPVHMMVHGPWFSPDAKRVVYLAVDDDKKEGVTGRLVVDGTPGPASPALLQNMTTAAASVLQDARSFGLWQAPDAQPYICGVSAPVFRRDGRMVFATRSTSPAKKVAAYGFPLDVAMDMVAEPSGEQMIVEGDEQPLAKASVVALGPTLGRDDHVGWVEWDLATKQWVGYVDGKAGPRAPSIEKRSNGVVEMAIAPDGSRIAFLQLAGGTGMFAHASLHDVRRVVVTGHEEKPYDCRGVTRLTFSDDAKHFAYEVHHAKGMASPTSDQGSFVVLDGVPGRIYSDVVANTLTFTGPDSVSYVARIQDVKDGPYRYFRVTQKATARP